MLIVILASAISCLLSSHYRVYKSSTNRLFYLCFLKPGVCSIKHHRLVIQRKKLYFVKSQCLFLCQSQTHYLGQTNQLKKESTHYKSIMLLFEFIVCLQPFQTRGLCYIILCIHNLEKKTIHFVKSQCLFHCQSQTHYLGEKHQLNKESAHYVSIMLLFALILC